MAKEATIRKHAKEELEKHGWAYWIPTATQWNSNDVFGIFDVIAWSGKEMRLIQYTSVHNINARKKKIMGFIIENDLKIPPGITIEVWGYEDRKGFTKASELKGNVVPFWVDLTCG